MERRTVDTGTVVVDVSPVVRNATLGGDEGLARLDLVLEAWRAQVDAFSQFILVADRSLRKNIPQEEASQLEDRLAAWGEHELAAYADPVVLRHAERHRAVIL